MGVEHHQHSLNSFVFSGLPLLFGFHNNDTEKSRETIATPPKRGVPTGPDSGPLEHARYPAPGGRYRRYLSLREGSEKTPPERGGLSGEWTYGIAEELPETDHGLEPVLAPGGRADELEKPRPRGGLYRLGNLQRRGLFGG